MGLKSLKNLVKAMNPSCGGGYVITWSIWQGLRGMGKKRAHLSLGVRKDLKMKWKGKLNKRSHVTFIIDKGGSGGFS